MSEADIQRLAEAIEGCGYDSDDVAEHMHAKARLKAVRELLWAMREPTPAMIAAGAALAVEDCGVAMSDQPEPIWVAMIDSLLS